MDFQIKYEILTSGTQQENMDLFLRDIITTIERAKQQGTFLVKLTFFLDDSVAGSSEQKRGYISNTLSDHLQDQTPPIVFIAQAPQEDAHSAVELTYVTSAQNGTTLTMKSFDRFQYAIIEHKKSKWLFLGLDNHHVPVFDFNTKVHETFRVAGQILEAEYMNFSNVIRQWNYIENITTTTQELSGEYQNYQIFNDIRATFYEKSKLRSDFPAATGIGCTSGGFALELIALNGCDTFQRVSIKSPVQANAYDYSKEVLIGNAVHPVTKQAPLFERAKLVVFKDSAIALISGTAAISGEKSIHIPDTATQTEITIKNILELLTQKNLNLNGVNRVIKDIQIAYLRVYVKNKADNDRVSAVCRKYFTNIPILLVQSDVCRSELLVEIEAAFNCHFLPID